MLKFGQKSDEGIVIPFLKLKKKKSLVTHTALSFLPSIDNFLKLLVPQSQSHIWLLIIVSRLLR